MTDPTMLALDSDLGHQRSSDLPRRFADAAESLRVSDGWANPATGRIELRTDLVLEGCGVKAPGLAGAGGYR
jgi:hypothetical protein